MSAVPLGLCGCGCGGRPKVSERTRPKCGEVKGQPRRFLTGHRRRVMELTPISERLLRRRLIQPNGCWHFDGKIDRQGYGVLRSAFRAVQGKKRDGMAHRLSYEAFVGPIPDGLTIDHLCHNRDATCKGGPTCAHRRCFNPEHLEPVGWGENALRSPTSVGSINAAKTHCPHGHEYTPENTVRMGKGRGCRACSREKDRRRAANKAARMLSP